MLAGLGFRDYLEVCQALLFLRIRKQTDPIRWLNLKGERYEFETSLNRWRRISENANLHRGTITRRLDQKHSVRNVRSGDCPDPGLRGIGVRLHGDRKRLRIAKPLDGDQHSIHLSISAQTERLNPRRREQLRNCRYRRRGFNRSVWADMER